MNTTGSGFRHISARAFTLFPACLLSFLALECPAETEGKLLHSFSVAIALGANYTNADGANPIGRPVLIGTNLYGTATSGGTLGKGTLFRVSIDGSRFTNMHNFGIGLDGAVPQAGLTVSGNRLFGTTSEGAANNTGGIYSINPDGSGYNNLYTFTTITSDPSQGFASTNRDGAFPWAGVVVASDTVYGTTVSGGKFGAGTIFAVKTNGTGFTNLHSFASISQSNTNSEGATPYGTIVLSGGNLYGLAARGGSNDYGTIYSISTNGSGFTVLYQFGNAPADGGLSYGGLLVADNVLYGTCEYHGSSARGTVFKINTDGSGYATLHEFSREYSSDLYDDTNWDGGDSVATLMLSHGTLVGAARNGGIYGNGTIFSVGTNGDNFAVVHHVTPYDMNAFTNLEGVYPQSGVVLSGDTLYGVAPNGGGTNRGTVFALKLPSSPVLNIARTDTNVLVSWPTAAVGYQLQSATNLTPGNWSDINDPLTVADTNFIFTSSVSAPPTFFRLQR